MASTKPPVVVYDACVLFPLNLRNVLVQCAEDRVVDARWTDDIHVEWIENLLQHDDRLDRARLERTRNLMKRVLPGADVQGYQYLIDRLTLADPDDRPSWLPPSMLAPTSSSVPIEGLPMPCWRHTA